MYVFITSDAAELRESCVNGAAVLARAPRGELDVTLKEWQVRRTSGTTFTIHGVVSFHVTRVSSA